MNAGQRQNYAARIVSAMLLLTTLKDAFIAGDLPERASPDAQTRSQWRNRFFNVAARLQAAGITLTAI
jgi:hypothetical protein